MSETLKLSPKQDVFWSDALQFLRASSRIMSRIYSTPNAPELDDEAAWSRLDWAKLLHGLDLPNDPQRIRQYCIVRCSQQAAELKFYSPVRGKRDTSASLLHLAKTGQFPFKGKFSEPSEKTNWNTEDDARPLREALSEMDERFFIRFGEALRDARKSRKAVVPQTHEEKVRRSLDYFLVQNWRADGPQCSIPLCICTVEAVADIWEIVGVEATEPTSSEALYKRARRLGLVPLTDDKVKRVRQVRLEGKHHMARPLG